MPLLPIVERELRVGARQPTSYRVRFWTAAATIAIGALMVSTARRDMAPHILAGNLFGAYGILALSYALLSGLFLTADSLSAERREQTLGFLFLTDLKGYDVVLGKLAATSLQSVYALLGLLPIIAVPLLMGGITGAAVVRLALTLLAAMFCSLAAGMLVSALSRETRQAILGTLGLLVGICGIFPLIYGLGRVLLGTKLTVFLYPSPVYTFIAGIDEFYRSRAMREGYWISLFVVLAMGVGFLAWACILSPRLLQEKAAEKNGSSSALGKWRYGTQKWRKRLRAWLRSNPVYWLFRRDRLMARVCWLFLGVCLAVWAFLLVFILATTSNTTPTRTRDLAMIILFFLSYGMHVIFKCLVAVEASRRVSEDAQSGALELLATTPIENRQFIDGFRRAMARQFFLPKLCLFAANSVVGWVILMLDPVNMGPDRHIFGCAFLLGGCLVFSDYLALTWTSLRLALNGRRHHRVILGTLGRVMLAPWVAFFVLFFTAGQSGIRQETAEAMVFVGLVVLFIVGLIQGFVARNRVRRKGFRTLFSEGQMKSTQAPVSQTESGTWNIENAKAAVVVKL